MTIGSMLAMTLLIGSAGQAPPCPVAAPVPVELKGWGSPRAGTPGVLATGAATTVVLTPTATFAVPPAKAPAAGTTGATLAFTIARPGRYRVALGAPAWIDLIASDKPVASAAHGHGPACSGVRKMVDFQLSAGRYSLQLSGASVPATTVMVVALK